MTASAPLPARRRVLVVEDEMMIAMLIEDMVTDLGHEVVGPAMTLEEALRLADGDIDCAILDMNLGHGNFSTPVAELLNERGIPFMFATGYGGSVLDREFENAPVLRKPFPMDALARTLASVLPETRAS